MAVSSLLSGRGEHAAQTIGKQTNLRQTINMKPTNLISVLIKYIPASSVKGSRVKLTLHKSSRIISYSSEYNTAEDNALAFLAEKGLVPEARACLQDGESVLLFDFKHVNTLYSIFAK